MASDSETLRARAWKHMEDGNFAEAVRICRRALLSRPSDADTRLLLGQSLMRLNRYNEVRVEMATLLRSKSAPAGAHLLHAESCYQAGDVAAAAKGLKLYLKEVPNDTAARKLLARVDGEELANQGTVERWFDPMSGSTAEYSPDEIQGDKTVITDGFSPDDFDEWELKSESASDAGSGTVELGAESLESIIVDPAIMYAHTPSSGVSLLESSELELVEQDSQSYASIEPVIISEEYVAQEPTRVRASDPDPAPAQGHPAPYPQPVGPAQTAVLAEFPAGKELRSSMEPQDFLDAAPTQIRAPRPSRAEEMAAEVQVPKVQPPSRRISREQAASIAPTGKSLAVRVQGAFRDIGKVGHAIVAAVLVLVVLGGVALYLGATSDAELRAAIQQAADDGRPSSLNAALTILTEEGGDDGLNQARRARLIAMATFEQGADRATEADQILAELDSATALGTDAVIARTYLQLVRSDPEQAVESLSVISTSPEHAGEIARVRSLAAYALDDLVQAVEHAGAAAGEEPVSSRHVSWLALLTAMNGNAAAGLETLRGVPNGETSPNVRVARARILQDSGSDPDGARREADAILGDLASDASSAERGWAQLVRARVFAGRGEMESAAEAVRSAQELRPMGDLAYYYELIAALLQLRDADAASAEVREMPASIRETERGALTRAKVALLTGNLSELSAALENSGTGGMSEYLRGRLFEARDDWARSNEFYERAERHAEVRARSKARRAGILLRQGQPTSAEELIRPLWERGVVEADVATVWVRTRLDLLDLDGAAEALVRSRSQFGDQHELMVQQLRLLLARGEPDEGLQLAERLAENHPRDPALQVLRYQAAGSVNADDIASAAFEAASQAGSSSPAVLIDLAIAAQELSDRNKMEIAVQGAERAGASEERLRSVRGRLMVLGGQGSMAVTELLRIPEDARTSADWASLIRAYTQAEQEGAARVAIERVPEHFEAKLGSAVIAIRGGSLSRAQTVLRNLGAQQTLTTEQRCRVLAYSAMATFEEGDVSEATQILERANDVAPGCSLVHLVRADIAEERSRPVRPHLQAAVAGTTPVPEALGRLAIELGSGAEACQLAERYIAAAPRGIDAREVRALPCP